MAYIAVFIPGATEAQRHDLGPCNILGRSPDADIWINEANVSRRHCKIQRVGRRYVLMDLKSTNGTWLDAARVRRYLLHDGETFYIGDARIVFHADQRIAHRPADPHEALSVAEIYRSAPSPADTVADSRSARAGRTLPRPLATIARRGQYRRRGSGKPLAFLRPPAMPMVSCPPAGGWVNAVLRTIRG